MFFSGGAVAVLKCSKMIEAWDTVTIPRNVQLILNPNLPPVLGVGSQGKFTLEMSGEDVTLHSERVEKM